MAKKRATKKSAVRKSARKRSAVRKRGGKAGATWTEVAIYAIVVKGRSHHESSYQGPAGYTNWSRVVAYFPTVEERDEAFKLLTMKVLKTCIFYRDAHTRTKTSMLVLRNGNKWMLPSNRQSWSQLTSSFHWPNDPDPPHVFKGLLKKAKADV